MWETTRHRFFPVVFKSVQIWRLSWIRYIYIYLFFTALSNCRLTADVMLDAFLLLVDKSKSSLRESGLRKFCAKTSWVLGRDGEGGACKHGCCQCLIPVTRSWYTPWLVAFDSLRQHLRQSLGFTRRVKQTWRACETLLHRTVLNFNISFFFLSLSFDTRNGFLEVGGLAGGLGQPRPLSFSAISDVTSPVKLVDRARFQASSGDSDSAN